MSTVVLSIYILMAVALIIGFIIGWLIRRSATINGYQRKIENLEIENDNLASELHIHSVDHENSRKHLAYTQEKLSKAELDIQDYLNKSQTLSTDLKRLRISKEDIEKRLHSMDENIKKASNELDLLKSKKDDILENINKIREYEQKIDQKSKEIDETKQNISDLISQRDALNSKVLNLDKIILNKEQEINDINDKIKIIEDEFKTKTLTLEDSVKSTRQKALNYQYAITYIHEKIDAGEVIKPDAIDMIISKNEEKGPFANLIQKLFRKSAKYIKEGRK